MRILVTGGSGFLGSAFVAAAHRRGHEVAVLDPRPAETGEPGVRRLRGSLEDPPWPELRAFAPEACLHAAWVTEPGSYLEAESNRDFRDASLAFLDALAEGGLAGVTALGSCVEHDDPPASLYARCKRELHEALGERAGRRGFALAWARVFHPYGPGEHPRRLCSALIRGLRAGEPFELRTPADVNDYVYVSDVAAALLRVTEARFAGALDVGTGRGLTVRELAARVARAVGADAGQVREAPPAGRPAPLRRVADAAALRGLGWSDAVDLDAGIRALAATLSPTGEETPCRS